ncbi:MAG TPA: hypothetical protein VFU37_04130, partial [Pyrinomonadaceae bacterium]|nr:hypothetical protein [Pyrinomonadaceae bacterium]
MLASQVITAPAIPQGGLSGLDPAAGEAGWIGCEGIGSWTTVSGVVLTWFSTLEIMKEFSFLSENRRKDFVRCIGRASG